MRFKYLSFIFIITLFSCGADNNIKKGEKYLALGEYYDAADLFKQAYSKTPSKERDRRGEIAKRMAYCYNRINASSKAIAAYRNTIRYDLASPVDHLELGRQLLKTGAYKEASKEFQIVIDSLNTMSENDFEESKNKSTSKLFSNTKNILPVHQLNKAQVLSLAKNGLESSQKAPQWKTDGSRYTVKKMDVFNSRRDDYSPILAGDQHDQLYFTSTRNDAQGDELSGITGAKPADIFISEKDDKGKWSKPEPVNGGLNTVIDEGACYLTNDGKEMYITMCPEDGQYPRYAQIGKSTRADAAWGKATLLEITKDTLSSYAHPAVTPDGGWLYFVSDMTGGYGGLDIWRARLTSAGVGAIENLGPTINTPGNEMFPTFRPNGDFYFSSDGHPGMGGLDIFIAKVGEDKRWHLEHPGYPLNSAGDDFGMTFEGLLNKGFFSSNRADQGRGWDKIYSFENPEIIQTVKGWVYEQEGYELPSSVVYMVGNDGTNLKISVKGDGSFEQAINPDVDYVFLATCDGYLNHKEELRVEKPTESEEYTLQFPLANISVPTLIRNIFYDFDKATLKPESTQALDSLVTLLNQNPNITIELGAHCDYRGSESYNLNLSQRRAESVVNYLKEHGIAADRLTPKGYGKSKPKTIRKKVTETYPWLKEGDQLTVEFIQKLSKEQQEICNQLNRRTEFTVLRTTYGMFDENGNLRKDIKPKPSNTNQQDGSDYSFFDF